MIKCKHCRETVRLGFRHHCPVQNREIIVVRDDSDFLDDVSSAVLDSITITDTESDAFSGGGGESGGGGSSGEW